MALTSAERQAKYRKDHPEKIKAYKKSDAKKASDRKYREVHGKHPANDPTKEAYKKYRSSEKYRKTSVNNHLKRNYGITLDEYDAMLDEQDGKCKICGKTEARKTTGRTQRMPLFVDHCHKTNQVRGLLCSHCNAGLGMFRENEELFVRAISYLWEYQSE
jgi:hypothetical protein